MYNELFGIKSKEFIQADDNSTGILSFINVDQKITLWNILVSLTARYASLKKDSAVFIFDQSTIFDYYTELQNLGTNVFTKVAKTHEKYDAIIVFFGDKTLSQQELYQLVSLSNGNIIFLGTYRYNLHI